MISPEVIEFFEDNGVSEEYLREEEIMFFDEKAFDSAIIGLSTSDQVVYDYELMVFGAMDEYGMDMEDAIDWISYNTVRSLNYINDLKKPIVVNRFGSNERI